ncbi:ABC transporter permease [Candidatus Bathyarchaeota archaeon]|nr:ABC transporter permease [Candidatus Bathyarchaeota archaeon]
MITSMLGKISPRRGAEGLFVTIGLAIILTFIFMAILAPILAPYDPNETRVGGLYESPNPKFPMGTDRLGRDILSRIIWGSRTVLIVTFLSMVLSSACGVILGLISGYVGGKFDTILSLFMDSLYAFPGLILAIALAVMLGQGIIPVTVSLTVVYVPIYFRMIRGEVLSIKESLFVEAAKAIGAKGKTLIFKYIFPNVIPSIPIVLSLNAADAVLTLAALSFLGLGLPAHIPDWGFDLRMGYGALTAKIWWPGTFPGLMIVLLTLGFSLFGEGLAEILNPKLSRR